MKIAIVCYASHGGSGTLATELGTRLASKGHKIHFISVDVPYRLLESPWKRNVYYHEVEANDYPLFVTPPYDLALANKIFEVCDNNGIEIIHSHYAMPHFPAAYLAKHMLAKKGKTVRTVSTFHGTDVYVVGEDPTLKDIIGFSAKTSDAVTAVSQSLANDAKKAYGIEETVHTIYNFVTIDLPKKPETELKSIFAPSGEKVLTHMSNFREVKRVQDVIQIFGQVDKKVQSKLILIGDGPEKTTAYKYAKKLNLLTKIHFLGLQSNVARLLTISDLFLLPSEKESFGLSALEAMACGVPVIATNTCGIPEVVEDGKNGYLSDIGDIKKMGEDSLKLLTDEKLYKSFSDNAIESVKEKFATDKIISQYEDLYKKVLVDK